MQASLRQCLSLTLSEHIKSLDLSGLKTTGRQTYFSFTWGLDGSGHHSNYHQLSKLDYTTKQVMSVCFSLGEVRVVYIDGNEASWKSSLTGSNRTQFTRPLALFPERENSERLKEFVPLVENEVAIIKEGLEVKIGSGNTKTVRCEVAKLSIADGKMVVTLLNLGRAYCTMGTWDESE